MGWCGYEEKDQEVGSGASGVGVVGGEPEEAVLGAVGWMNRGTAFRWGGGGIVREGREGWYCEAERLWGWLREMGGVRSWGVWGGWTGVLDFGGVDGECGWERRREGRWGVLSVKDRGGEVDMVAGERLGCGQHWGRRGVELEGVCSGWEEGRGEQKGECAVVGWEVGGMGGREDGCCWGGLDQGSGNLEDGVEVGRGAELADACWEGLASSWLNWGWCGEWRRALFVWVELGGGDGLVEGRSASWKCGIAVRVVTSFRGRLGVFEVCEQDRRMLVERYGWLRKEEEGMLGGGVGGSEVWGGRRCSVWGVEGGRGSREVRESIWRGLGEGEGELRDVEGGYGGRVWDVRILKGRIGGWRRGSARAPGRGRYGMVVTRGVGRVEIGREGVDGRFRAGGFVALLFGGLSRLCWLDAWRCGGGAIGCGVVVWLWDE
ncbi:hypothetical protein Tco_1111262 [Tanacetum coccineum]|uniref:Uncharacterized protein n=1 Tax=Tanacetum coccineum TaxID=301880 RepID=A0ABQ5IL40_9ASTR